MNNLGKSEDARQKEGRNLLFMEIICKRSNLRTSKHVLSEWMLSKTEFSPIHKFLFLFVMFSSKEWRKNLCYAHRALKRFISGYVAWMWIFRSNLMFEIYICWNRPTLNFFFSTRKVVAQNIFQTNFSKLN